MDFTVLKEAVEAAVLIDGHAHNIVAIDSTFPFIGGLTEAHDDALSDAVHSISVKVPLLRPAFLLYQKLMNSNLLTTDFCSGLFYSI